MQIMSTLTHAMHRPIEPLSDVDMNMVKMQSSSQSSQKNYHNIDSNRPGTSKSPNQKSHDASSSSQKGSNESQPHSLKRKSDNLSDNENHDDSQGKNCDHSKKCDSSKKPKKRVSLTNESEKDREALTSTAKDDKRLEKDAKSEEKRKEKEAKEEEKRKEKEAKEEEKRKEKEAKDEKRKEKEAKEEEKRKERQAREAEKAKKDAEKAAKEAEKEAKRNKEMMQTKKLANFMSAFVQKPAGPSTSPKKQFSNEDSDFDRTFLPCTFKNLAPINRFERIPASDFDSSIGKCAPVKDQLLHNFLSESNKRNTVQEGKFGNTLGRKSRKGIRVPVSVRESMRLITEAGVLGDDRLLEENGKRGLANLADRKKLPIKLLHFASDRRPAWYGTWSRSSNFVSARKPLAQDPVALDYSYDSDAEWEDFDPMEGDDLGDNDEKEDDHESRSDSDSEMDDWLVDDLEEEEDGDSESAMSIFGNRSSVSPTKSLKGRNHSSLSPSKPFINKLDAKKKPKKFKPIGRRFETKLVKFETGPHWESQLGVASYEGFNAYQMEMLNDTYIGLDPFTFTSNDLSGADNAFSASTLKSEQPVQIADDPGFVSLTASTSPSNPNKPTAQTAIMTKAKAFPEEQLKDLLSSIEGSSFIRPILIEGLHSKYAAQGKTAVPKTTLEACLTTYAEKQSKKAGGKWVIKAEYRKMAGL